MKTATIKAKVLRRKIGKLSGTVILATAMTVSVMASAFADRYDDRGYAVGHHHRRHQTYHYVQPAYPYYYAQPVYAPPPVYYAPEPSPGVSLFFPINIR